LTAEKVAKISKASNALFIWCDALIHYGKEKHKYQQFAPVEVNRPKSGQKRASPEKEIVSPVRPASSDQFSAEKKKGKKGKKGKSPRKDDSQTDAPIPR
jgi:hypothetical protein